MTYIINHLTFRFSFFGCCMMHLAAEVGFEPNETRRHFSLTTFVTTIYRFQSVSLYFFIRKISKFVSMVSWQCTTLPLNLLVALFVGSAAFLQRLPCHQHHKTDLWAASENPQEERRSFLAQLVVASAMVLALPSTPSYAGLLDEFGSDPDKIVIKEKVPETKPAASAKKGDFGIDPTLRACKSDELV